jgi:hypothetical protein
MFFNNDFLFVAVASSFIVGGVILTYSFYNNILPTVNQGESLVNTNSISNLDSNIQFGNLPNHSYVEASVQTANIQVEASVQAANTYVNTGMQTSARMWLESIKNWINEILGSSTPNPGYVDAGVQTMGPATSMWSTVKQWFLEVCSIRSSELSSLGQNKVVNKWINKLDSVQEVSLQDSESSLTNLRFGTESNLQQLVNPDDSASNISEIVSLSNLQDVNEVVSEANRVYDMSNRQDVLDLMNDPTVIFGVNGAYDPADDLITFITPDSSYEIVRSTLDALLNSEGKGYKQERITII